MPPYRFPAAIAATVPPDPGRASAAIFRRGQLELRWYAPQGVDRQSPHTRDEVYVVVAGRGTYLCNGVRTPFEAGDALFAPAGVEHRFEDFTSDFATWVMFYGPEGGERDGPGGEA